MFTDRFIKLPGRLYDNELKELTGKEIIEDTTIHVNPMEICEYLATSDKDDGQYIIVYLKCGERFSCYLTMEEFERRINEHQE